MKYGVPVQVGSPAGSLSTVSRFTTGMRVLLFLIASTPAYVSTIHAQTGGAAGIEGTIVDQSGAPIPGATVTATNNATGTGTTREASGAGVFTIVVGSAAFGTFSGASGNRDFQFAGRLNF